LSNFADGYRFDEFKEKSLDSVTLISSKISPSPVPVKGKPRTAKDKYIESVIAASFHTQNTCTLIFS